MQILKAFGIAFGLTVVYLSGAHAKSFCPVPPQTCNAPRRLTRLPNGAIAIRNICDLQAIPGNDYGNIYELKQNIDATCTSTWGTFTPISGEFASVLKGNGHWVNGLFIQLPSTTGPIGLFESVGLFGSVENISLTAATISNPQNRNRPIAAIAGINKGSITSSEVLNGSITSAGEPGVGGIVAQNHGLLLADFFSGTVASSVSVGGVAGINYDGASILNSSSAGSVQGYELAGGLASDNAGNVEDSSSSSSVSWWRGDGEYFGALLGRNINDQSTATVLNSYASGSVRNSIYGMGGLVGAGGIYNWPFGTILTSYAVGQIQQSTYSGGFVGWYQRSGAFGNNYWDQNTTEQQYATYNNGSISGVKGLRSVVFKSALPAGFDPNAWAQVPGISYPFDTLYSCPWNGARASNCTLPPFYSKTRFPLRDPNCSDKDDFFCLVVPPIMSFFEPPLAQFTAPKTQFGKNAGVYTVLPIGQLQLFEYTKYNNAETSVNDDQGQQHPAAKLACFGTVYTMLARLIGQIYPEAKVVPDAGKPNICRGRESAAQAHIDCLLEDSDNLYIKGLAIWPSSLEKYAKGPNDPFIAFDDSAVRKLVEAGQLAIVRGTAGGLVHVMLVTSEIKDSTGAVIRFVANDPELGMQVFIDVNQADGAAYHRAVMHPLGAGNSGEYKALSGFDFKVTDYKPITWQKVH